MNDSTESNGVFDGLSYEAIWRGVAVDIVATLVSSIGILYALGGAEAFSGDLAQVEAIDADLRAKPVFFLVTLITGALSTVLGAFVAARRAGVHHVRHGGWAAAATTLFTALLSAGCTASREAVAAPLWFDIASWMLIIPAGAAGGLLAKRLQPSDQPSDVDPAFGADSQER